MRKLLVVIVVLLLAAVVADRVAVGIAQGQIASRVQTSQGLASKPEVKVHGFPFLTQVLRGRYRDVTATVPDVGREGLRFAEVRIDAEGVRVDLGDLINGAVKQVPVDQAHGQVLLTYDDLNTYLAQRVEVPKVKVSKSGSNLRVNGSLQLPILDRSVSLSGNATVDIQGENITLRPEAVTAVTGFLPDFAQESARQALTVRFAVHGLPFGVRLDSAKVTDKGLLFQASATGLTLTTS